MASPNHKHAQNPGRSKDNSRFRIEPYNQFDNLNYFAFSASENSNADFMKMNEYSTESET